MWFETTPRIVDAAARFLADGDAIIVDLRGNGGGSAESVQRLISYFFAGGSQELMRFHDGLSGETRINRVLTNLPSPRLAGKPFYVAHRRQRGVGGGRVRLPHPTIQTRHARRPHDRGAANNNALYPVRPYFVASISVGRPEHPVSRSNWEGKGIAPHVDIAPPAALDQAHLLALQTLAQRSDPARRTDYDWDIAGLQARVKPMTLCRPPRSTLMSAPTASAASGAKAQR